VKVPWNDRRCVRCARESEQLTEEHIIPKAIGGALSCRFLCKRCNDQLGEIEAGLRCDPAIRLAIEKLKPQIRRLWQTMAEGQPYVVTSKGGTARAKCQKGTIRVDPTSLSDGSLIRPVDGASDAIQTMLRRRGAADSEMEQAAKNLDAAPEDTRVPVTDGIEAVKWTVTGAEPALGGRSVAPLALLKIAYEYLALLVGDAIFDRYFDPVRDALVPEGRLPVTCNVERVVAGEYRPFHGLLVEKGFPVAVQIRLFGYVGCRVEFSGLRIQNCPRVAYTLHLDTGEEKLKEVE
jgi:hypothetical protein